MRSSSRRLNRLCPAAISLCLVLAGLAQAAPPRFVIDQTFGAGGVVRTLFDADDTIQDLLRQPDGKLIAVGTTTRLLPNGFEYHTSLVRYNIDGRLDPTFGTDGKVTIPASSSGVAGVLQPDGKLLTVGRTVTSFLIGNLTLARLNSNGSLDGSFAGGSGIASPNFTRPCHGASVALQADGKIVVSGGMLYEPQASQNFKFLVARFNSNGTLDTGFGANGYMTTYIGADSFPTSLFLRPDGQILLAGYGNLGGTYHFALAQYTSAGVLDPGFGTNGIAITYFPLSSGSSIFGGELLPDGKLLAVGQATSDFALARYLPNGSLDQTFGNGGVQTTYFSVESRANAVVTLPDGRIVAGGGAAYDNDATTQNFALALYSNNGTPVSKSVTELAQDADTIRTLLLQPDGKLYGGGSMRRPDDGDDFALARYRLNPSPSTPFDFDGDGKADIAIYRPDTLRSYWHILRSSDNTYQAVQFGAGEDRIIPADFDGDGRANIAIWRPSNGTWYTSQNAAINYGAVVWGQRGDIPVPGDFDADGKADYAIYRPSNTNWYIYRSSDGGFTQLQFGVPGCVPLLGDFDGDGKSDFAYTETTDGVLSWTIRRSLDNVMVTTVFGDVTDKVVPVDYDGDGRTNIAVFRPSTGKWYTSINPNINFAEQTFGQSSDLPVAADYDGDGAADLAVFRTSTLNWYILRSTDGVVIGQPWGLVTDTPVELAYVR